MAEFRPTFLTSVEHLGWQGALQLQCSRRNLRRILPDWTTTLRPRALRHPFHFRHGTTDRFVIAEVFLGQQYRCLLNVPNVKVIVDAGANIGTASVVLLNAYPEASLIALEPDPGNFAVLARNLEYYGRRAVCLQKALWHEPATLTSHRDFRDGGEWSIQVRPSASGAIEATTLQSLMDQYRLPSIDILKMDIEGAEREVFDHASTWLGRVRIIATELHNEHCRAAFATATAPYAAETTRHGEVTLWRRLDWSEPD